MSPTMGKQNLAVSVHDHFNEEKSWKCKRSIGKNNLGGIRNTAMGLGYQKKKKRPFVKIKSQTFIFLEGESPIHRMIKLQKNKQEKEAKEKCMCMWVYKQSIKVSEMVLVAIKYRNF